MNSLQVFNDPHDLASAAAGLIAAAVEESVGRPFFIALSGGATPAAAFRRLVDLSFLRSLDWSSVSFGWSDERTVPPHDSRSNFRLARENLLDPLNIPDSHIWRMAGELEPLRAAENYESLLRKEFSARTRTFDLLLLGLGADGHTASLFPGTAALNEESRWVVANFVPHLDSIRLTLTAPCINRAARVVFLVSGDQKASALSAALAPAGDPSVTPARLIRPFSGEALWLVDRSAARLV